jgi:hypothetical protein
VTVRGPVAGTELDTELIERRMFLYYTQDGLGDLCLGACMLAWGLAIRFDMAAFIGAFCAVAVTMVWPLKRWLTYPRAGYARLRTQGAIKVRFRILAIGMLALGLVVFLLVSQKPGDFVAQHFPVVFGAVFGLFLSVVGYWLRTTRFYLYGLLLFLAGAVHQWGGVDLWATVTVAASVIIGSGAWILVRFLRDNPVGGEKLDA